MITTLFGIFFAACMHARVFDCYALPPPPCEPGPPIVCYNYDPVPVIDKPGNGPRR